MLKNTLIIALLLLAIYFYYQQKQNSLASFTGSTSPHEHDPWAFDKDQEIEEVKKVNKIFADFCKNEIGGQDINEIRTKLNGRTLAELLEENEVYETKTDELKRKKGELEAEVISLTNTWRNRVGEKERIITRITQEQKDLETKVKSKAKLLDEEQLECKKLGEQIERLETEVKELKKNNLEENKTTQELENKLQNWSKKEQQWNQQLKAINLLFDEKAKDYKVIDFNGLYTLLKTIAEREQSEVNPVHSRYRKKK